MLHIIKCQTSDTTRYHDCIVSKDAPSLVNEKGPHRGHLSGKQPVYDLEAFLRDNPEVPFLVIREYDCSKLSLSLSPLDVMVYGLNDHLKYALPESISIVSDTLRTALRRVAVCGIDEVAWHQSFPRPEMAAPYLFLYHHRKFLRQLTQRSRLDERLTSTHVTALLRYLDRKHGKDFQEADQLLQKRKTSKKHFEKLFRPHDAILVQDDNVLSGWVPDDWPRRTNSGLSISCWRWNLQGQWLQREQRKLDLSISGHGQIDIEKLGAYPLQYAPLLIQKQLEQRGQKYWDMRYQSFVCYNGHDFEGDKFYVSH